LLSVSLPISIGITGLLAVNCFAQQQSEIDKYAKPVGITKIDSLQNLLETAKADTNKVKILNELCWEYKNSIPDKALKYGKQALQLAQILLENSISSKTVIHCKKAKAISLNHIGVVYDYQGNYENALSYYLKALKINEELNDRKSIATGLNNVGIIHYYQGENYKAFDYYMQALKIRRELSDKKGIAGSLNNIGLVHMAIGNLSDDPLDYNRAITCFQQSLKLKEELENSPDKSIAREGKQGVARALGNIGSVYKSRGNLSGNSLDYKKAIDYHMSGLKKFEELGDKKGISISLHGIGDIYGIQGEYEKAIGYIYQSLNLAEEMGSKNEIFAGYQKLSELYEKQNNIKKALEYYKLYSQMKDSLLNKENSKQIIEMQAKYESEKKQKEIDLLAELKTSEAKRQTIMRNSLIGLLLLVLTFALFLYYRYREKKRSNIVQEKLSLVASKTDNYVIITDKDDTIEWINEGFTRITGYSLQDVSGKKPQHVLRGELTDLETTTRMEEKKETKQSFTEEILNYHKNGKPIWLSVNVNPILNKKGEVIRYINIGNDITEQKTAKEKLESAYKIIAEKNEEITDSIKYAKQIQESILPKDEMKRMLPNSFILFKPKDIVSGDFYWCTEKDKFFPHGNRSNVFIHKDFCASALSTWGIHPPTIGAFVVSVNASIRCDPNVST
ncbi:MAG: tetratricopeptide repeat protein, partial [Bacteroidetes bacterium]|nr:tetratricopeptide repeat protein [Bacteroidota bacterium]